jgi:hypothetical protein
MADMEHPPMTVATRAAKSRPAKPRPGQAKTVITARPDPKGGEWHTVTFGDVTITTQRPSDEEIQRNAEASTAALRRALPAFLKPGIRIYPKKDVPLFWADEDNPAEGVIRKLNGKIERGVVDEDGNFKAID